MSERIRQLTGGHKCEHGTQRTIAQFKGPYAGPVRTCECCRSPFGALQRPKIEGYPDLCPTCASRELNEIIRLTDRVLRLELDLRDATRS